MKKTPDEAHRLTDQKLAALEKRIAAEYKKASDELTDKINAYFESFKKRDEAQKKLIGTTVNGREYTEQDYKQWQLAQIGRGRRFEALRDRVAERMTGANEVAAAYINDTTPGLYSLNRNYAAYTIEQQVGTDVGFDLWDEQTVKRLIVEQPDLMPYYPPKRAVKRGIDLAWGRRQITAQVTSGILQGESIKHLADRLQTNIPNMNRTSAIRAARTAVTGAQNAGRQDSYAAAVKMGIDLSKRWVATLDGRTRHDHAVADGQTVAEDKPFTVGGYDLMYPGDPSGPGHEIYNCRCTMIAKVKGVDMSDALRRDQYGILPNMTYAQWEASKRGAEAAPISTIRTKEVLEWQKTLQNQENLAILKAKINSGEISTKISVQQQQKHIEGAPQYERYRSDRIAKGKTPQSIFTLDIREAQNLVDRFSCTGTVTIAKTGETSVKIREYVTTDAVVGKYYADDEFHDTKRICIYYGKKGTHVVPITEGYGG